MSGIDYDRLAENYAKYRQVHPEVFRALLVNSAITNESKVLEVGCGTGNYIIKLQEQTGCRGWGVEPSVEMLKAARSRSRAVGFSSGRAEEIGLDGIAFDFIFSVDVIHFVRDRGRYLQRSFELLRKGGRLCTVTDSTEIIRKRRPLSNYFPETVPLELERYPKDGEIRAIMQDAGFSEISEQEVYFERDVTDISLWKNKASSSLHLIPERAFDRGIAGMEADLKKGPIKWVSPYLLIWGKK